MNEKPSLYERIGGEEGVENLVIDFYVRVMKDPELAPFFRHTSIEKLHKMQHEFFCAALGGPITYTGEPIAKAHHGRGITARHFTRFVTHLLDTLEDMGISNGEAGELINRVNQYVNEVTGTSY